MKRLSSRLRRPPSNRSKSSHRKSCNSHKFTSDSTSSSASTNIHASPGTFNENKNQTLEQAYNLSDDDESTLKSLQKKASKRTSSHLQTSDISSYATVSKDSTVALTVAAADAGAAKITTTSAPETETENTTETEKSLVLASVAEISATEPPSSVSGPSATGPRRAMSNESIKKDESKLKKMLVRLLSGVLMVSVFLLFLFSGHFYICTLIFFTEVILFRELVKVRYNTWLPIIENSIPFFRTTQWLWFVTAIFYTYSDFVVDVIKSNTSLHYLLHYAKYQTGLAFLIYNVTFVVTIATLQKDHIRFQINQLCWTILVLCLTVGQLKYIMHNVYNGLIWFALPIMLVVFNDSFAWLAGITCGRKFIQKEFVNISPNKTWEGFIGGGIGTMVAGWHLSRFMAQYTWMVCPTNKFELFPDKLICELDPVFQQAKHIFPHSIFEVFPQFVIKMIPSVVDICTDTSSMSTMMVDGTTSSEFGTSAGATAAAGVIEVLTPCISGNEHHTHHHFELVVKNFYPVQIHALGLSLFASFIAPFGGFLASAIKRAYHLKDFASFIPGHGGMMDRMDCQFLMALCTWVHYNTFVKMATISVPKMIYMYNNLNDVEQKEFMEKIIELTNHTIGGNFIFIADDIDNSGGGDFGTGAAGDIGGRTFEL